MVHIIMVHTMDTQCTSLVQCIAVINMPVIMVHTQHLMARCTMAPVSHTKASIRCTTLHLFIMHPLFTMHLSTMLYIMHLWCIMHLLCTMHLHLLSRLHQQAL